MKIDGKTIAAAILEDLRVQTQHLLQKRITPHLYIILLSDDASSTSYVKQKMLRGEEIKVKITVEKENPNLKTAELIEKIKKLNSDKNIHGIIVQRPLPEQIDEEAVALAVDPKKDIDGFNPNSKFNAPVALAVLKLLQNTHKDDFESWLKTQNITVIGKGVTAGKPIISFLKNLEITPNIISSQTSDRKELLQNSDIIISAVGKANSLNSTEIKKNAVLIGVGMHKGIDSKFHGDFDEEKIQSVVSFYSPTPGGVGPVNVACLMQNLIEATKDTLTT